MPVIDFQGTEPVVRMGGHPARAVEQGFGGSEVDLPRIFHAGSAGGLKWPLTCINTGARYWD
jgi:hypothetical protein